MARERRNVTEPVVFVGLMVTALIALVWWGFRTSDFASGGIKMKKILICEELDENLEPVSADRNIPPGSQQVCLWFDYSGARRGDAIEISWNLEDKTVQRETVRLSKPEDIRAFYLLKEDGSPLDPGFYSVTVNCNGKDTYEENFTVAAASDDYVPGNVIIWD
jgi:hypothetical protein